MVTSGAIYSGLPQNECVKSSSDNPSLQRPKSVSLIFPCTSSRIFSGY